jgi:serine/threonine protein phosphatase PrpC
LPVKLEYIRGVSWPGDRAKPNEDAFCHSELIAAVFDGATGIGDPVLPADSDAAWVARKGAEKLIAYDVLGGYGALTRAVRDLVRDFDATKIRDPQERYEIPRASMMLVAPDADRMLALWFGDCAALVRRPGEAVQLVGDAFEKRRRETAFVAKLAEKEGIPPTSGSSDPRFLPAARAARNRQNTAEGSWAFSPDTACVEHVKALHFEAPEGTHILLCSDGFLALASDYGRYDADGLITAASDRSLRPLLEELRSIEDADPQGRLFPRFKKSDDATALQLCVV